MTHNILRQILDERPKFHRGETEIRGRFPIGKSLLNRPEEIRLIKNTYTCYGIDKEIANFIYNYVNSESNTLETGAGISTLIFALKMSKHIVITPNKPEIIAIKKYAKQKKINFDNTTFVTEESNKFLPQYKARNLDLVFIDGKHAFPWPIVDWFYTSDKLKKGGYIILDDVQIYSVTILRDFMKEDPHWELFKSFKDKTIVFRKISSSISNVAWHMQPYLMNRLAKKSFKENILNNLRGFLNSH